MPFFCQKVNSIKATKGKKITLYAHCYINMLQKLKFIACKQQFWSILAYVQFSPFKKTWEQMADIMTHYVSHNV